MHVLRRCVIPFFAHRFQCRVRPILFLRCFRARAVITTAYDINSTQMKRNFLFQTSVILVGKQSSSKNKPRLVSSKRNLERVFAQGWTASVLHFLCSLTPFENAHFSDESKSFQLFPCWQRQSEAINRRSFQPAGTSPAKTGSVSVAKFTPCETEFEMGFSLDNESWKQRSVQFFFSRFSSPIMFPQGAGLSHRIKMFTTLMQ